jgi:hypothetical protein
MEAHEMLRAVYDDVSPKQVATGMGISLSLAYKWAEPPEPGRGSGTTNPLERMAGLIAAAKDDRLIKWLCRRAGGFFVKNPAAARGDYEELVPATNEILQQFADLLAAITESAGDHRITAKETKEIRRHWDELKSFTEGFVRACEDGDFDKARQPLRPR